MARGDKAIYNQQQQQAFGQDQSQARQDAANQQQSYGSAYGGFENMLANPGYSAGEQQAMRQATSGSLAGAFGAAQQRVADRSARTGNSAGADATEEQLALNQGRENAQALGGLEGEFANARRQDQDRALSGLGGLYGTSTQGADAAMSTGANLVGTEGRVATTPGFWSLVLQHGLNSLTGGGR